MCEAPVKVSNLLCINIEMGGSKTVQKRVSRKMAVQALLGVVLNVIGVQNDGTMPALSYVDSTRTSVCVPMDNLSKSLDYYNLQNGDTVRVEWPNDG